ncbi:putative Rhomboid family intramembrane serine protease [Gammaproteobacteria bacterium]
MPYLPIVGLPIILALMPECWIEWMAYDREAILEGEWWRLWSGHFTHFTIMHAFVNSVLLLLLVLTLDRTFSRRFILVLFLAGPIAISLGVALFVPEMTWYRGGSALVSLLMALLMCHAFSWMPWKFLAILYVGIIGWLIKLFLESQGMSLMDLPYPVHIAWQAHLTGSMIGVTVCLVLRHK